MAQKPTAKKLEDADIDRLDAVDDPASGRKWLLLKFTDTTQEHTMNAEQLEKSTLAMVEAFKSDDVLRVGEKSAESITEVMKALGIEGTMKATEATEAEKAAEATEAEKAAAEKAAAEKAAAEKAAAEVEDEEKKKKKKENGEGDDEDKDKLPEAFKALTETVKSLAETVDGIATAQKEAVEKSTKSAPASTQAKGTEEVTKSAPKMGEGLFGNFFESKT